MSAQIIQFPVKKQAIVKERQFRESAKYAIKFEALRPGSFFKIVKEPSRYVWHSTDERVYQKAYDGFYAENYLTGEGCVLMPEDLVMPLIVDKGASFKQKRAA